MGRNLYVGNLSYSTTEDDLRRAFSSYGQVERVSVITDRDTGRPRGFAFVDMATEEGAHAAIAALNETTLDGRQIRVSEARPRESGSGGGGRGNRAGGRAGRDRDRW